MAAHSKMKADTLRNPMFRVIICVIALSSLAIVSGCRVNRPANDHAATQTLYTVAGDIHETV